MEGKLEAIQAGRDVQMKSINRHSRSCERFQQERDEAVASIKKLQKFDGELQKANEGLQEESDIRVDRQKREKRKYPK